MMLLQVVSMLVAAVVLVAGPGQNDGKQVTISASWRQFERVRGVVTVDEHGSVIIVGGTTGGPSVRGGEVRCTADADIGPVSTIALCVYTNGAKFYGKGIHSTVPNGKVEIRVNGVLVHTIVCNTKAGKDWWPSSALIGSGMYTTVPIPVAGKGITGRRFEVRIKAAGRTAADVNRLVLTLSSQ